VLQNNDKISIEKTKPKVENKNQVDVRIQHQIDFNLQCFTGVVVWLKMKIVVDVINQHQSGSDLNSTFISNQNHPLTDVTTFSRTLTEISKKCDELVLSIE